MNWRDEIAAAERAGVLTAQTARALQAHIEQRRGGEADEERVRVLAGFNDLFVVIACLLLLLAVYWQGTRLVPIWGAALLTPVAWGLSEYFVRRRAMALPAVVLPLCFLAGVIGALAPQSAATPRGWYWLAACALPASWLYWRRFATPVVIAAGLAVVSLGLLIGLSTGLSLSGRSNQLCLLALGFGVFAWAMWWDRRDTRRVGLRSDVAFWLHLLAAPLLVHPVFSLLDITPADETGWPQALTALGLYLLLALCALAIDRRALLLSALGYVLYTLSTALNHSFGLAPPDGGQGLALTALLLGGCLLLLSAFWPSCRQAVLRCLPTAWLRSLPPGASD